MYPTKPGDIFTAKAIGTWPELPDWSFDGPEDDPDFWAVNSFGENLPEGVSDLITFHGPKGTVVMCFGHDERGGYHRHYADQHGGRLLQESRWNPETMRWDQVA